MWGPLPCFIRKWCGVRVYSPIRYCLLLSVPHLPCYTSNQPCSAMFVLSRTWPLFTTCRPCVPVSGTTISVWMCYCCRVFASLLTLWCEVSVFCSSVMSPVHISWQYVFCALSPSLCWSVLCLRPFLSPVPFSLCIICPVSSVGLSCVLWPVSYCESCTEDSVTVGEECYTSLILTPWRGRTDEYKTKHSADLQSFRPSVFKILNVGWMKC